MKKSGTAESRFRFAVTFHYSMMAKEGSIGFSSTPREFIQKLPSKNAETHELDRQQMLKCVPENAFLSKLKPQWEAERTQELKESRRLLASKLEELSSIQYPKS